MIARQPRLLLLDEPLTNIDPEAKEELSSLILEIHSQMGLTTLFVSHEAGPLLSAADRVISVVAGRIVPDFVEELMLVKAG